MQKVDALTEFRKGNIRDLHKRHASIVNLGCSLLTTASTTQNNGEWHPETFARLKDIFLLPYQESPFPLLPRQCLSAAGVYFSSHPARRSRRRCYCYTAWFNEGHKQSEGIRRTNRGKRGREKERHHCRRSMLDIRAATVRFSPPFLRSFSYEFRKTSCAGSYPPAYYHITARMYASFVSRDEGRRMAVPLRRSRQ